MPQDVYDAAPAEARDGTLAGWVHWVVSPGTPDDFFEGAYWAFSWTFERFFGGVLGPQLLEQATNVEELQGGEWVPLA